MRFLQLEIYTIFKQWMICFIWLIPQLLQRHHYNILLADTKDIQLNDVYGCTNVFADLKLYFFAVVSKDALLAVGACSVVLKFNYFGLWNPLFA